MLCRFMKQGNLRTKKMKVCKGLLKKLMFGRCLDERKVGIKKTMQRKHHQD